MKKLIFIVFLSSFSTVLMAQSGEKTNPKYSLKPDSGIVSPVFPGGPEGWSHFLSHYIRYPKDSYMKSIQGQVVVQMMVEIDGSLSNLTIVKSPAADLSTESLRVIALSPKWKPATKNGKPVRTSYIVPIDYKLSVDPAQQTHP